MVGTWNNLMLRIRRWPRTFVLLFVSVLALSGCYYSSGSVSYSVTVITVASPDTTFEGMAVSLESVYAVDNAAVYITAQDWTVTGAPLGSTWALDDDGRSANFIAATAGTYTVRYRTWYYTNWDYNYCYCTVYSSYRESFATVTVVPAPPG